ncbi:MAG: cell division protein ZapA [Gammaproteobacteria bacterium]
MKQQDSLSINILDKEYRVACPEEEKESLLASASVLNKRLRDIKNKGAVLGTERIAIMAALNLSHEMLNGKAIEQQHTELNNRIDSLSDKIDGTIRQFELI